MRVDADCAVRPHVRTEPLKLSCPAPSLPSVCPQSARKRHMTVRQLLYRSAVARWDVAAR